MRLDLGKFQPGAYAELREETPYGLVSGMQPKTDTDGNPVPIDLDSRTVNLIRYMVKEWNVTNIDGDKLPSPRSVSIADLEFVKVEIISEIIQAIDKISTQALPDPNSSSVS